MTKSTFAKSKKSKKEFHSSYTKIVQPHYSVRNISFNQDHLHYLRIFTFILIAINSVVLCVDSVNFSATTQQILKLFDFALLMIF